MKFLLDTHVLIQWHDDDPASLPPEHSEILDAESAEAFGLSEISLWEIATLYELGRITIDVPLREWLHKATAPPLVTRVGITPEIAAEVAALPATFQRDPADRIIVATARVLGTTLLTRDGQIVESGLVDTL